MDAASIDQAIVDHATRLFLRYFGASATVGAHKPTLQIDRDREMLRLHWAISPVVQNLVTYVLEHRYEIQSILESTVRIEDGVVRGRMDTMATLRKRRLTGLSTLVVSHEPARSYASGANQVLLWVLSQSWALASRFKNVLPASAAYHAVIDLNLQRLGQARRLQPVTKIMDQVTRSARPTGNALVEARRSRRELYRRSAEAFDTLVRIEAGDPDTIAVVLRETLLAPLEPWRRYELMVGYCAADTLAEIEGSPLSLGFLAGDNRAPIGRGGRYAIYWQATTEHYKRPEPELSETLTQEILDAYGMPASSDRPDLIVVDELLGEVVAVIEVKYLTGEDATDRARAAFAQVVRYSRGYRDAATIRALIGNSLVAVSQGVGRLSAVPVPSDTPLVVDFDGITHGGLREWSARLVH